jgi:hypothetical protein
MPASTPLRPLVDALEQMTALDSVAKTVGKTVRDLIGRGEIKDAISGTWLGHAVHPPLTDVVIGSFLGVSLLDLLGGEGKSSQRLLGVGLAAAVPTALTGVNDWADTEIADDAVRRVGLVHAAANTSALMLYAASLGARRRGARGRGAALALSGTAVMTVGGYLGATCPTPGELGQIKRPLTRVRTTGPPSATGTRSQTANLRRPWRRTLPCCCSGTATGSTPSTIAALIGAACSATETPRAMW